MLEHYILICRKGLPWTNTLAYWAHSKVRKKMKCCEYGTSCVIIFVFNTNPLACMCLCLKQVSIFLKISKYCIGALYFDNFRNYYPFAVIVGRDLKNNHTFNIKCFEKWLSSAYASEMRLSWHSLSFWERKTHSYCSVEFFVLYLLFCRKKWLYNRFWTKTRVLT
jgi:hypothetical protein